MKIFYVYLLFMHSPDAHEISTAFVKHDLCEEQAKALNAKVGDHRGYRWDCKKQAVER